MKIACLQFNPALGEVEPNIENADTLLVSSGAAAQDIDLLVLPELAFSGYNFPSLETIKPHLEPTASGISAKWSSKTARDLNCVVVTGYAEDASSAPAEFKPIIGPSPLLSADPLELPPGVAVVPNTASDFPYNFNSSIAISPSGSILAHYRKSSLYYTDTTWAREGSGFWTGVLPLHSEQKGTSDRKVAMGICMDLNAHNFTSPMDAFEFAHHVIQSNAEITIVSMAWLSHDLTPDMVDGPEALEPDNLTLFFWVKRLGPLLDLLDGKMRILVLANRCGFERDVCYAGTSAVIGVKNGNVFIWDVCGKGEERLLVVDTDQASISQIDTVVCL